MEKTGAQKKGGGDFVALEEDDKRDFIATGCYVLLHVPEYFSPEKDDEKEGESCRDK